MNGHKWECFLLELSFAGWLVLGVVTLGLSDMFYSGAYKMATMCEYYAELRKTTPENGYEEVLNDTYLFEKADKSLLAEAYPEAVEDIEESRDMDAVYGTHGIRRFFTDRKSTRLNSSH